MKENRMSRGGLLLCLISSVLSGHAYEGTLDYTFGVAGIVTLPRAHLKIKAVHQSTERIFCAGSLRDSDFEEDSYPWIGCYTLQGEPIKEFGQKGRVVETHRGVEFSAIAVSDKKLLAGGKALSGCPLLLAYTFKGKKAPTFALQKNWWVGGHEGEIKKILYNALRKTFYCVGNQQDRGLLLECPGEGYAAQLQLFVLDGPSAYKDIIVVPSLDGVDKKILVGSSDQRAAIFYVQQNLTTFEIVRENIMPSEYEQVMVTDSQQLLVRGKRGKRNQLLRLYSMEGTILRKFENIHLSAPCVIAPYLPDCFIMSVYEGALPSIAAYTIEGKQLFRRHTICNAVPDITYELAYTIRDMHFNQEQQKIIMAGSVDHVSHRNFLSCHITEKIPTLATLALNAVVKNINEDRVFSRRDYKDLKNILPEQKGLLCRLYAQQSLLFRLRERFKK